MTTLVSRASHKRAQNFAFFHRGQRMPPAWHYPPPLAEQTRPPLLPTTCSKFYVVLTETMHPPKQWIATQMSESLESHEINAYCSSTLERRKNLFCPLESRCCVRGAPRHGQGPTRSLTFTDNVLQIWCRSHRAVCCSSNLRILENNESERLLLGFRAKVKIPSLTYVCASGKCLAT